MALFIPLDGLRLSDLDRTPPSSRGMGDVNVDSAAALLFDAVIVLQIPLLRLVDDFVLQYRAISAKKYHYFNIAPFLTHLSNKCFDMVAENSLIGTFSVFRPNCALLVGLPLMLWSSLVLGAGG